MPGEVSTIEYDPNRSSRIALIKYADGDWRYILATNGMRVGDRVESGERCEIRPGNALPLRAIPTGTLVHNVEMKVGKGGQIVRGAGTSAQVLAKEDKYTLLRLPSGEVALRVERLHGHDRPAQRDRITKTSSSGKRAGNVIWV